MAATHKSWTYLDTGEVFEEGADGMADFDRMVAALKAIAKATGVSA